MVPVPWGMLQSYTDTTDSDTQSLCHISPILARVRIFLLPGLLLVIHKAGDGTPVTLRTNGEDSDRVDYCYCCGCHHHHQQHHHDNHLHVVLHFLQFKHAFSLTIGLVPVIKSLDKYSLRASMAAHVCAYMYTCIPTYLPTCLPTYLPTYLHTYIHTYIT